MAKPDDRKRVFISYSQDSEEHKNRVLQLSQRLRYDGIDCQIDQYETAPPQGWRRWMEEKIEWADFVLAICTPTYHKRARRLEEPGRGLGATYEISLLLDLLYEAGMHNERVIPITFQGGETKDIPKALRSYTRYHLGALGAEDEDEYESFYRHLTDQPRVIPQTLGPVRQLPAERTRTNNSSDDSGHVDPSKLERWQTRFLHSLRPLLAGGVLIPRTETQELLSFLEDKTKRISVVHGAAGSGKSGILLELAQALADRGDAFLPLRLDRLELKGDPKRFGRDALELSDSPGRYLSRVSSNSDQHAVLILDQLDALRWTGAHSSEAWDVCRETIQDALDFSEKIKIVICCRTFDLQHDPQLRIWGEEAKGLRKIEVGDLTDEQVRQAVARVSDSVRDPRSLDARELKLLRHVHHLQMWLAIYPRVGLQGSLSTRRALLEAFWQDRRGKLEELGLDSERVRTIEEGLVIGMQEGRRLTAPSGPLRLSNKELSAYQSLQILQADPITNRISFCHQSYLDYLVALRIVENLPQSEKGLLIWLGQKDRQSLFRREQLRIVLEEIRDQDPETFLDELSTLLAAGNGVRFHLRLLCLQFISQVGHPSASEKKLVLNLLDDPYWFEHVVGEIVRGNRVWFEILDDEGISEAWLNNANEDLRDKALNLLASIVDKSGDRVARLLRPYLDRDETWNRRIRWVLRYEPHTDSDSLFEIRLHLMDQGIDINDHINWSKLARNHPLRFVQLACHRLLAFAKHIIENKKRGRVEHGTDLDWFHLEKVTTMTFPAELIYPAWKMLFKSLMAVLQIKSFEGEDDHILESHAIEIRKAQPVIDLLRRLGKHLLNDSWDPFCDSAGELAKGSRRGEILFFDTLREGPTREDFADWALHWLMEEPWRARYQIHQDASERTLACLLIERLALHCTEKTFRHLEDWLLSYREPDLLDSYRVRHQWIQENRDLGFCSVFGRTPYAILPCLPPSRVSQKVVKRIAELNRKFGLQEKTSEDGVGKDGFICSPIGAEALCRMSTNSLTKVIIDKKISRRPQNRPWRWNKDHFEITSSATVASDFRTASQANPEKFGKLLLQWPSDGNLVIFKAILSGLAFPGDHVSTNDHDSRKSPPCLLLADILSLPVIRELVRGGEDSEIAGTFCSVLQRYAQCTWPREVLDLVIWIATHHPDPVSGYFPVGSDSEDRNFNRLEMNALNVTRGKAGYAIQGLLFKQPHLFEELRPAIEALTQDSHSAVKVAALAACLPVININKDQAIQWFVATCNESDDLLAAREAKEIIRYSYHTHLEQLLPTLDRMIASPSPRVATAGATWVAAAFLVMGEIQARFEQCLTGAPELRRGVAEVAADLISNQDYAEKAQEVLLSLSEDPDKEVAQKVARSFRKLDLQHATSHPEVWRAFASSHAFQSEPSHLLMALEKQSGDLRPFSDCLLAAGTTFAEELAEAASDIRQGIAGDASHYLLPLLLRLYEQSKDDPPVFQRCLDLWDRLLEQRVGAVMGLTQELDRF